MAPTLKQKINRSLLAALLVLALLFVVVTTVQTVFVMETDSEPIPAHVEEESTDIAGIYWPVWRP